MKDIAVKCKQQKDNLGSLWNIITEVSLFFCELLIKNYKADKELILT